MKKLALLMMVVLGLVLARSDALWSQASPAGPGELGLPGVTIFGQPQGPGYTVLSTSNQTAQWINTNGFFNYQNGQFTLNPALPPGSIQYNNGGILGGLVLGTNLSISGNPPALNAAGVNLPLALNNGGTGTSSPIGVQAGPNVTASGTFPNQIISTSGVPSGVINVKDAVYGAKGDCVTDDTASIQSVINNACLSASPHPVIYAPSTPGSCYMTSAPLRINCGSLTIAGAGNSQATIQLTNAYGPTFLMQNPGALPGPFIANIPGRWQASHSFATNAEIIDSNGNVEVATTGGTSGTPNHPTWALSQGSTTTDNTVTWTLEVIGSSWNGTTLNILDANAFGTSGPQIMDLSEASWPASVIPGAGAITNEAEVVPIPDAGQTLGIGIADGYVGGPPYNVTQPGGNQFDAFTMKVDANGRLYCYFAISGTVQNGFSATSSVPFNQWDHLACVFTGSAILGYVNGTRVINSSVSGTISTTSSDKLWLLGIGNGNFNAWPGYVAWERLSSSARYTGASFTAPTTVPANDSNTVFLMDMPATPAAGLVVAHTGTTWHGGNPVYLPYTLGASTGSPGTIIRDMTIEPLPGTASGGPAIWSDWSYNSRLSNLSINLDDTDYGIEFFSNNFQTSVTDSFLTVASHSNSQNIALEYGSQCGGCTARNIQFDGTQLTTVVDGPTDGGHIDDVRVTSRGTLLYPFIGGANTIYSNEFIDEEANGAQVCSFYAATPFSSNRIVGGEWYLRTGSGGEALICQNGGAPTVVDGTYLSGAGAAELVNIIANPTAPVELRNVANPAAFPVTNSGKTYWVHNMVSGQDVGMKFADLPSCVAGLNGTLRFLTDGTIGATCAGSGTGAWAKCINTTWVCN